MRLFALVPFRIKTLIAKAIGEVIRITGRGGGTTLPGRLLLRMEPDALSRLAARITGSTILVSATNGKTTTASLLEDILIDAGRSPVRNRAGSNMSWGVATALLSQRGEDAILEVDEAWLPKVAHAAGPDVIALGNLFRDQLDRYGELESIAESWKSMLASPGATRDRTAVLNADDPVIADLGSSSSGADLKVVYFGVEDVGVTRDENSLVEDSKYCRRCGSPLSYSAGLLGHLGHYRCTACRLERPHPTVSIKQIELLGMEGSRIRLVGPDGEHEFCLPLPGLYNAYNALTALAAAQALGISLSGATKALESASPSFGRVETVELDSGRAAILLIKNPAGASEVARTVASAAESDGLDLWIALNDKTADGRDISWVWDAEFEKLAPVARRVSCSGTRAEELALRLVYAGFPRELIEVDRNIQRSFDAALSAAGPDTVYALPTYTALLEIQALLARRDPSRKFLQ